MNRDVLESLIDKANANVVCGKAPGTLLFVRSDGKGVVAKFNPNGWNRALDVTDGQWREVRDASGSLPCSPIEVPLTVDVVIENADALASEGAAIDPRAAFRADVSGPKPTPRATYVYTAPPEVLDSFQEALRRGDVRAKHTRHPFYVWMFVEAAERIAADKIRVTFTPRSYIVPNVKPWAFQPPEAPR